MSQVFYMSMYSTDPIRRLQYNNIVQIKKVLVGHRNQPLLVSGLNNFLWHPVENPNQHCKSHGTFDSNIVYNLLCWTTYSSSKVNIYYIHLICGWLKTCKVKRPQNFIWASSVNVQCSVFSSFKKKITNIFKKKSVLPKFLINIAFLIVLDGRAWPMKAVVLASSIGGVHAKNTLTLKLVNEQRENS